MRCRMYSSEPEASTSGCGVTSRHEVCGGAAALRRAGGIGTPQVRAAWEGAAVVLMLAPGGDMPWPGVDG
ncbi:hypothetical protein GCM10007061_13080 [Kocuria marina]|nr:hypothetical protein GCM10007061_13080 [Kocuria marina]